MAQPGVESGAVRKDPGGRLGVALVYPNAWRLGMANLGFHAVYRIANDENDVLCERAFLPEEPGEEPRTVESGRPLRDFDVVAFSLSFEDDYVNVLDVLRRAGIPLRAADRDERYPLVVAGGIAVQINPEPLAPFFDLFLVGEGEELLPSFFARHAPARGAGRARRGAAGAGPPARGLRTLPLRRRLRRHPRRRRRVGDPLRAQGGRFTAS